MNMIQLSSAPFPFTNLLRLMHRILPLERKFYPLIKGWVRSRGLLNVPWGPWHLHFPAAWLATASELIYKGPEANHPEFYQIIAPELKHLKRGRIVDVGANFGVYVLCFRACCDAPIIAYEPTPVGFALLSRNVGENHMKGVELRNLACGNVPGEVVVNAGINSFVSPAGDQASASSSDANEWSDILEEYKTDEKHAVSAKLVRLDDDLNDSEPVSFLKLDCEGMEYDILDGARELLRRHKPIVFVELHPLWIGNYGRKLEDVCDLLRPDYDLKFWDFNKADRSRGGPLSGLSRIASRYRREGEILPSESAMLERAASPPRPAQIFLLAKPKQA